MYKIPANTLFVGKNLVFVPECHSTNSLLMDLAQKTLQPEGTLVIAHQQSNGRGQRGNSWEAEPGKNLTMSLLLKPSFLAAKDQFALTIVVSLALTDYLIENLNLNASIKWPNDLMIDTKKVGGILIENSLTGEFISQSVVGIGLNVNQQKFAVDTATSLALHTEREFELATELDLILSHLESRYLQLREGKISLLKQSYLQRLFWINEKRTFKTNEREFSGEIKGVDAAGRLAVDTHTGTSYFVIKEISFLR